MNSRSLMAALGAATVLPALLAGCGTTESPAASKAAPEPTSEDCTNDSTETSTGPVSLTDGFGRKVELEKPAERVAVLEWQQTEDLLTLCVNPIAVADPEGYSVWDSAEELPEGTTDVGLRGETNLEKLFAQEPDLVVIEAYTPEDEIIAQLEEYDVPVLATKGADTTDPIGQMKDTFSLIAEATGREERAELVLEEFDNTLEDAKAAVEDADTEISEFVYYDAWLTGNNVGIRPFGQGSLMGELGEELGLTNAWKGEVDPAYGLGQTDIEGMTEYADATFFYTSTDDPSGDVYAAMADNPAWKKIDAVAEGRNLPFPKQVWTFGGPRTSEQVLNAYVEALTGSPLES